MKSIYSDLSFLWYNVAGYSLQCYSVVVSFTVTVHLLIREFIRSGNHVFNAINDTHTCSHSFKKKKQREMFDMGWFWTGWSVCFRNAQPRNLEFTENGAKLENWAT